MAAPWEDGDVEEDDDEVDETVKEATRDNVICVVDARSNMFVPCGEGGKTHFAMVLECLTKVLKNKIITSENDMFGVVFVGTKTAKNLNSFDHIHFTVELDNPSATMIKQINDIANGVVNFSEAIGSLADTSPLPLHHAIWACSNAFASGKAKAEDFRRIWIFTNDDNPVKGNSSEQRNAVQKAKDCFEVGEEILLYAMPPPSGKPFDITRTWTHVVSTTDEDGIPVNNVVTMSAEGTFDNLLDRVRVKSFAKRVYARLPLTVAPDVQLGVSLYFNINHAKKPSATFVDGRTNSALKVETSWLCKSTGKRLLPHEIKTYYPYGGEKVPFEKDELKALKTLGATPGLVLMGFKPSSVLSEIHNLRPPYFVYPNEDDTIGSTTTFIALHTKMLELDRIGIARLIPRASTAPRLVALVAQPEVVTEGCQVSPPGMYAIPLPYADDIRLIDLGEVGAHTVIGLAGGDDEGITPSDVEDVVAAERAAVAAAETVIRKIDLKKFSCQNFENPTLQKHYAVMEALALGEDDVDWVAERDDHLLPDVDGMAKYTVELETLRDAIGASTAGESSTKKRRAPAGSTGTKRSKPAPSGDGEPATVGVDWAAQVAGDKLASFTIPMLKECLTSVGLRVSGKKQELIDRIKQHFGAT